MFGYYVSNSEYFGAVEFDEDKRALSIKDKAQ